MSVDPGAEVGVEPVPNNSDLEEAKFVAVRIHQLQESSFGGTFPLHDIAVLYRVKSQVCAVVIHLHRALSQDCLGLLLAVLADSFWRNALGTH